MLDIPLTCHFLSRFGYKTYWEPVAQRDRRKLDLGNGPWLNGPKAGVEVKGSRTHFDVQVHVWKLPLAR